MNSNLVSAIIGFWRMGATIEEIISLTLLSKDKIEEVIDSYALKRYNQLIIEKIGNLNFERL